MASPSLPSSSPLNEFQLGDEENLVLTLAKFWLMEEDRLHDPDLPDQVAKEPDCLAFAIEFHRACQMELGAMESVPGGAVSELSEAMTGEGWASSVRRALGDLAFDDFRKTIGSRDLLEAALSTIERRARAVVLCVELAAFFPWPRKVKFEKSVRTDRLAWIAGALPRMTSEYMEELDREIKNRTRKLALKSLNWKKMGLIAGGGAVLGLITGGLAAPAVGAAIGGWMGFSGAAAVNAGLALVGGGSLAAGGFGVAGGTLVITGVAGVGFGSFAAGGATLHGLTNSGVMGDMVKLDVLTEYYLLRELREPEKARAVIQLTQESVQRVEEKSAAIDTQLADLERRLEEQLDGALDLVEAQQEEIKSLKSELKESKAITKTMESGVHNLERSLAAYEDN